MANFKEIYMEKCKDEMTLGELVTAVLQDVLVMVGRKFIDCVEKNGQGDAVGHLAEAVGVPREELVDFCDTIAKAHKKDLDETLTRLAIMSGKENEK